MDRRSGGAPLIVAELAPLDLLVAPVPGGQAVALMPSQEVQRARLERRHPQGVPSRYVRGWQTMTEKLAKSGTYVIVVDGLGVDDTIAEVERFFARRLAEGPVAAGVEQRRELLRYANHAVLHQYLGWARHTPGGDVSEAVLELDCECAGPACDALVKLPIADASTALASPPPSVLASGH